jgi:hypothetical protein
MLRKKILFIILAILFLSPSQLFSNEKEISEENYSVKPYQIEGICKRVSIDSEYIWNKVVIENSTATLSSTIQSCDNKREEWTNILYNDTLDKLKAKKLKMMSHVLNIGGIEEFIPLRCSAIRNEGWNTQPYESVIKRLYVYRKKL